MFALIRYSLLLCVTACLCGCQEVHYYRQAVAGQYDVLARRKKITTLIADTNTPPELCSQLLRVEEIRRFAAKRLNLPADSHYLDYADLGRPYAVWNVYAAPELSFQPYTWWYPMVGRLSYRGFFSEADARACASRLEKKGYDVCVGGVTTYSTLGWFDDPILNTFIDMPEADFVEVIFHELAHQKIFLPGDTEFNEAFATAVAGEGVRLWFESRGDAAAFKQYEVNHSMDAEFTRLVLGTVQELQKIYADASLTPDARRSGKQAAIERLRERYEKLKATWKTPSPYDAWISSPMNNAKLGTIVTYNELAPLFDKLIKSCHGDWTRFYEVVDKIGQLPPQKRRQALIDASSSPAVPSNPSATATPHF
jgi:predicted aminopeptidase